VKKNLSALILTEVGFYNMVTIGIAS